MYTGSDDEQEEGNEQDVDVDEKQEANVQPKPRPLHLTKSVYVKRVPPNVTTADIEQVSKLLSVRDTCPPTHTL